MCRPYTSARRKHDQEETSNQTSAGQGQSPGETVLEIICCHRTVIETVWTCPHERLSYQMVQHLFHVFVYIYLLVKNHVISVADNMGWDCLLPSVAESGHPEGLASSICRAHKSA